LQLRSNKRDSAGIIKVQGVESDIGQAKIWFTFGLEDFITRNFIYFKISGANSANQYFMLYKSDPMKNTNKG
jgi:hypothetical protein